MFFISALLYCQIHGRVNIARILGGLIVACLAGTKIRRGVPDSAVSLRSRAEEDRAAPASAAEECAAGERGPPGQGSPEEGRQRRVKYVS